MKKGETMSKQERACRDCGGKAKIVRKDYLFKESGLNNVLLKSIEVVTCAKCKNVSPRIPQHEDLMRTIAVALIDKPSELAGDEVRFLRKYLGEGSERFAQMLGIDRSHLSRVENGALAISKQTDRLVRALAWIHDPKLLQKMKQLNRHKTILVRLSEIDSDADSVQVQVGHDTSGYTYDLKTAA
jgi:DNA-binding transcriptional regulator YiaG